MSVGGRPRHDVEPDLTHDPSGGPRRERGRSHHRPDRTLGLGVFVEGLRGPETTHRAMCVSAKR